MLPDSLEFDDGKLMLGKMQSLKDVNYSNLIETVGEATLVDMLSKTDLM